MHNPVNLIKHFYEETVQEIKKCTWPSRPELAESTLLVLFTMLVLTAFVWGTDLALNYTVMPLLEMLSGK